MHGNVFKKSTVVLLSEKRRSWNMMRLAYEVTQFTTAFYESIEFKIPFAPRKIFFQRFMTHQRLTFMLRLIVTLFF